MVDRLLASPALRRALGPPLARRRPLRRHRRLQRRLPRPGGLPLPRLRHRRFNRDKPYDQFLREQLAGDLLPAADGRAAARAGHRHRLPGDRPPLRLGRRGVPPDARRHDRQPRQGGPRADHQLRPLPRPQVRPDPAGRLLRPLRHLPEHPLRLPRDRDLPTPAGPRPARPRRAVGARAAAVPGRGWRSWIAEIVRTYSPVETLDTGKEKDRLKARVKELQDEARRAGEGAPGLRQGLRRRRGDAGRRPHPAQGRPDEARPRGPARLPPGPRRPATAARRGRAAAGCSWPSG